MSISILDFFVLYILKETTIIFLHITCKIFSLDFFTSNNFTEEPDKDEESIYLFLYRCDS